ncbi:MAG: nucleotidyltransferase [Candidatus Omnitrophica bacterium]|nr:nucleotidyltransferase [Candidatus Omnitrophota bacterium]
MTALERALALIARFLDEHRIPYMIIGGIANLVWGEPRSTLDVDASLLVEETQWPSLMKELRSIVRIIPRNPIAFLKDTHVLPVETSDGVRIDLIWATLPYEHQAIARATIEEVTGQRIRVRVCRPEDLVIHKVLSARPKDQEDVRAIIHQQRARLDRPYVNRIVGELAKALDRPEMVEFLARCFRESR